MSTRDFIVQFSRGFTRPEFCGKLAPKLETMRTPGSHVRPSDKGPKYLARCICCPHEGIKRRNKKIIIIFYTFDLSPLSLPAIFSLLSNRDQDSEARVMIWPMSLGGSDACQLRRHLECTVMSAPAPPQREPACKLLRHCLSECLTITEGH